MENYTSTPMHAPANSGGYTKRNDISVLPHGPSVGVIYAVVHLGTQLKNFQGNSKEVNTIFIGVEYPQLKQLFYVEDTVPRSTVGSIESAYSMAPSSKLREVAEAVIGRKFSSDEEANAYDITNLIGAKLLFNNVVTTSTKDGKNYNKITGVFPLGDMPIPVNFNPELQYHTFSIDPAKNNFKTLQYANLPNYLKKKIVASKEGKEFVQMGGQFAKKPENNQTQGQSQGFQQQQQTQQNFQGPSAPIQQQQPAGQKVYVHTDTQFTEQQYKASMWTEEGLVSAGKGYWQEPALMQQQTAPAPQQMQQPASPPQIQQAPQQQTQQFNPNTHQQTPQQTYQAEMQFQQAMQQPQQQVTQQAPQQQGFHPQTQQGQVNNQLPPSSGTQLPPNSQQPIQNGGQQQIQNNSAPKGWLNEDEDDDLPF